MIAETLQYEHKCPREHQTELHTEMWHGLFQKQIAMLIHPVNTWPPNAPAVSLPDAFSRIVLKDNQGVKCNQAEIVPVWQVRSHSQTWWVSSESECDTRQYTNQLDAGSYSHPSIPDDWRWHRFLTTCHCKKKVHLWDARWHFLCIRSMQTQEFIMTTGHYHLNWTSWGINAFYGKILSESKLQQQSKPIWK